MAVRLCPVMKVGFEFVNKVGFEFVNRQSSIVNYSLCLCVSVVK